MCKEFIQWKENGITKAMCTECGYWSDKEGFIDINKTYDEVLEEVLSKAVKGEVVIEKIRTGLTRAIRINPKSQLELFVNSALKPNLPKNR